MATASPDPQISSLPKPPSKPPSRPPSPRYTPAVLDCERIVGVSTDGKDTYVVEFYIDENGKLRTRRIKLPPEPPPWIIRIICDISDAIGELLFEPSQSMVAIEYSMDGVGGQTLGKTKSSMGGGGQILRKITRPEIADDGKLTATFVFTPAELLNSTIFVLRSITFLDNKGTPLSPTVVPWTGLSSPIEMALPHADDYLRARASAINHNSKYRTLVSGYASDTTTERRRCVGPFEFRIQKQKKTKRRSNGETVTRVAWTTLPKKYQTNKKSGRWNYYTLNLIRGTYRSVIYGKCGLLGFTTNTATLKR